MMNIDAEGQELLDQIKQHIDPRYQAGMAMAVPTGLKMYGVRVPRFGRWRAYGSGPTRRWPARI